MGPDTVDLADHTENAYIFEELLLKADDSPSFSGNGMLLSHYTSTQPERP
jgi:hypothetical protein